MDKIKIARNLLASIEMPKAQQNDICALTILALAEIKPDDDFSSAQNNWRGIHQIIGFMKDEYKIEYAENTRESVRKTAIHPFLTAAIIEDNGKATNSPKFAYRFTPEFFNVVKSVKCQPEEFIEIFDDVQIFDDTTVVKIEEFLSAHQSLKEIYASKKKMQKMPVVINELEYTFSPGKHNQLQKAIIEEFRTRFAPYSECLYVGDTIKKDLVKVEEKLQDLGFNISTHDKMPDVILYREDKNWIYFIEAVTSSGPMDPERIHQIEGMTKNVTAGKIYVTAFLNFKKYKEVSNSLAWETEVWIAETPEHMIHLNGDRFLGPR